MAVERNRRKTKVGIVVSDKMDKTVVVAIEDFVRHSLYGKEHEIYAVSARCGPGAYGADGGGAAGGVQGSGG